ncbi:IS110 family transposase [Bacteroidales bacterium OttesenSCG-928-B11]|nr:IS110 family transposase [Bacteroidales bacterium OttesenSCG-928-B11]
MKNYDCIVGIDVSKLKLDVVFLVKPEGKQHKHIIVSNDKKGIKGIVNHLKKNGVNPSKSLFCFEDTGVYSSPLCYYLSANQLRYWIIPALEIKRSKGISRGKTDKSDARDIAFYAHTHLHKIREGKVAEKDIAELKLLISERDKLLKSIRLFESNKENEKFLPAEITKKMLKINKETIKHLKKSLLKIEARMLEIVSGNEMLSEQQELLTSIIGIGTQTAINLIVVTKGFTTFDNWRQLACYAGVAPFEYSSGSSIRGRTKVSHLADKKLKSLLNMCAMTAVKLDSELRLYYERKVAEGKSKMLVLNNVRAKLLARAFAVINRGTPYLNIRKYAS